MSHPPHLPPKTCSVPFYQRLRLAQSIIFIAVFAFLSGLVGGIISDTYITPEYDAYTAVIRDQRTSTKPVSSADPLFVRAHTAQTLMLTPRTSYEKTGYVDPSEAILGVLLTDTGWFVAPLPTGGILARNWVAVDDAGTVFDIRSLTTDAGAGVVYGFLDGTGFRVVSFPPANVIEAGLPVWAQGLGTFSARSLEMLLPTAGAPSEYAPDTSVYTVSLNQPVQTGSIVWAQDGTFFGFVNSDGTLLPWFVIQSVYTDVFTGTAIAHPTLPFHGHIVLLSEADRVHTDTAFGFLIRTVDKSHTSDIAVGDVVTRIAGQSFAPWTLDAVVATTASDDVSVTIVRDGVLQEVTVPLLAF